MNKLTIFRDETPEVGHPYHIVETLLSTFGTQQRLIGRSFCSKQGAEVFIIRATQFPEHFEPDRSTSSSNREGVKDFMQGTAGPAPQDGCFANAPSPLPWSNSAPAPSMTLPNGDVLLDGDWGRTGEGKVLQVWHNPRDWSSYGWKSLVDAYTPRGQLYIDFTSRCDIIARAPAPSTRPADEMDLTALCKPVMAWHPDTLAEMKAWTHGIECLCSNGRWAPAPQPNWIKNICYRAKPAPAPIRAEIPWAQLHEDIQQVAQAEDGSWWCFVRDAEAQNTYWSGIKAINLHYLLFPRGTEHWADTLQKRPEASS